MIFDNPAELKDRIIEITGRKVYSRVTVSDDTSNYMLLGSGSVLRLDGGDYYITADAKEGRFGIGDQPKLWVKYAFDLTDGSQKIIKLVFLERFTTSLGPFTIRCDRDPDKESAVLEAVAGDRRFMQGRTVRDVSGNNVRIIDRIRGDTLFNLVATDRDNHERYFERTMPGVLRKVHGALEALDFLHRSGLQHGDVRNDHIFVERDTGDYRWIDFDYQVNYLDYDVWSVGNILTYVAAKGILTCRAARRSQQRAGLEPCIAGDDALLFFKYRLANLRKIYPYIPAALNELLMRFSTETMDFYTSVGEIVRDLGEVLGELPD